MLSEREIFSHIRPSYPPSRCQLFAATTTYSEIFTSSLCIFPLYVERRRPLGFERPPWLSSRTLPYLSLPPSFLQRRPSLPTPIPTRPSKASMHITINLPSESNSHSHTINLNEATQDLAALSLSPSSHSPSMNTVVPASSDDHAWASLYPIPSDLDIGAKPWSPGPHKKITLISSSLSPPSGPPPVPFPFPLLSPLS